MTYLALAIVAAFAAGYAARAMRGQTGSWH